MGLVCLDELDKEQADDQANEGVAEKVSPGFLPVQKIKYPTGNDQNCEDDDCLCEDRLNITRFQNLGQPEYFVIFFSHSVPE